jgi:hypothetical protein
MPGIIWVFLPHAATWDSISLHLFNEGKKSQIFALDYPKFYEFIHEVFGWLNTEIFRG